MAGQLWQQALRQGYGGQVGKTGKNHLFQGFGLVVDFFSNIRMGVAMQVDPPAADGVYVLVAVFVYQVSAFSLHNGDGSGSMFKWGKRVPDNGFVSFL